MKTNTNNTSPNGWREYYKQNQDAGSDCDLIACETIKYNLPIIYPTISNITDKPFGQYDIDLAGIIKKPSTVFNLQPTDGDTLYIEAELRMVDTIDWQLRAPLRKYKYFVNRPNSLYIHINRPQNRMALITGPDLIKSKQINMPNRYNPGGEQFFVPEPELVRFHDITPLDRFSNIDVTTLGL